MAGIDNVYGKILGSPGSNANAYCTFRALQKLRKGRVLKKMSKMRDRIGLKEEIDKERQIKEEKRRKEQKKKKSLGRDDKRHNRNYKVNKSK